MPQLAAAKKAKQISVESPLEIKSEKYSFFGNE